MLFKVNRSSWEKQMNFTGLTLQCTWKWEEESDIFYIHMYRFLCIDKLQHTHSTLLQPDMDKQETRLKNAENITSFNLCPFDLASSAKSHNVAIQRTKCCCRILSLVPQFNYLTLIHIPMFIPCWHVLYMLFNMCLYQVLMQRIAMIEKVGLGDKREALISSLLFSTAHDGMKNWYAMDLLIYCLSVHIICAWICRCITTYLFSEF